MKTIMYLVMAALMAMLILAPAALAQDVVEGEDDVLAAEWEATVLGIRRSGADSRPTDAEAGI